MKVENNDLELFLSEFFNDKHISSDIGAVTVITEEQMVTVLNKENGVGTHSEAEGSIMSDIFGFDENLFLPFGYNPKMYNCLDREHKKVLNEVVVIKYLNNVNGNLILLCLPIEQATITTEQLNAIKYLNQYVEKVVRKIRKPIKILATDRHNSGASEINSMKYKIIPYLEKHIDDTYKQSISDEKMVAQRVLTL